MKFEIGGKRFVFNLSLETDELTAPIEKEMFKAMPEAFAVVASYSETLRMMPCPRTDEEWNKIKEIINKGTLGIGYNLIQVNQWLREKKYMRRLLALLLVEEGKEFSEDQIPEMEKFMMKHATRQIASDVVNHFFMRRGDSENSTPQSSMKEMRK